eukprot:4540022-Prymnesium_polylepis.1
MRFFRFQQPATRTASRVGDGGVRAARGEEGTPMCDSRLHLIHSHHTAATGRGRPGPLFENSQFPTPARSPQRRVTPGFRRLRTAPDSHTRCHRAHSPCEKSPSRSA